MARLVTLGFELQSVTAGVEYTSGSGSVIAISTATKHGGAASMRVNVSAQSRWFGHVFSGSLITSAVYVRTYIYVATAPSVGNTAEVISMYNSGAVTQQGRILLNNDLTLTLKDQAGNTIGSSSALSLSTWYRVELLISKDATTMTARLDGTQFATSTTATLVSYDAVYFGASTAASTFDIYYDDIAVNDTTGSSQNSWCGDGYIVMQVPASSTTYPWQNTSGGAGASTNYQLIDETTPNDATDYVQSIDTASEELYTLSSSGIGASDTVNVVHLGWRLRHSTGVATSAYATLTNGIYGSLGGVSFSPATTTWITNGATTARSYYATGYNTGSGFGTLNATNVNAMTIKMGRAASGYVNSIQVTKVWTMVDYTPAGGGGGGSSSSGAFFALF